MTLLTTGLEDGPSENLWIFSKQHFGRSFAADNLAMPVLLSRFILEATETQQLAQGHTSCKGQGHDLHPTLTPEPMLISLRFCSDSVLFLLCTDFSSAHRSQTGQGRAFAVTQTWIQAPDPSPPSCVTSGKELHIPEPQL